MPSVTPNYGLTKPDPLENYDVGVPNANMDIIDLELKDHEDKLLALAYGAPGATPLILQIGKLRIMVGSATLNFPNTNNSTVAVTAPSGFFTNPPYIFVSSRNSNYWGYHPASSQTATNLILGLRTSSPVTADIDASFLAIERVA